MLQTAVKPQIGCLHAVNTFGKVCINHCRCGEMADAQDLKSGSSLFSVELELRESQFAGNQVEHSDEMDGRTIASSSTLGCVEDTV